MNQYETIFIYSPDFSPEKATSVMEKIKSAITQNGGEIVAVNEWGKRRLAYRISGQTEGVYVYIEHNSPGKVVGAVENIFRVTEGILRYLVVRKKIPKKVAPSKKQAEAPAAVPALSEVTAGNIEKHGEARVHVKHDVITPKTKE